MSAEPAVLPAQLSSCLFPFPQNFQQQIQTNQKFILEINTNQNSDPFLPPKAPKTAFGAPKPAYLAQKRAVLVDLGQKLVCLAPDWVGQLATLSIAYFYFIIVFVIRPKTKSVLLYYLRQASPQTHVSLFNPFIVIIISSSS